MVDSRGMVRKILNPRINGRDHVSWNYLILIERPIMMLLDLTKRGCENINWRLN